MATLCLVLFKVFKVSGVIAVDCLRNPQRKESGGIRSGYCGGQSQYLTMHLLKMPCKKDFVVFTVWTLTPSWLKPAILLILLQQSNE
jgi:hypothetical protein